MRSFDPVTRAGDVLLDDGAALRFDGDAFDRSGLRLLRLGQRVRLSMSDDGAVDFITLATFPDPR